MLWQQHQLAWRHGDRGPESALMGAAVGAAMGSGFGGRLEGLSPEKTSPLQDMASYQQRNSQEQILNKEHTEVKADQMKETLRQKIRWSSFIMTSPGWLGRELTG